VTGPGWGRASAEEALVVVPEPRPVLVRKRKHDGSIRVEWEGELVATAGERWLVVHHEAGRHHRRHAIKGETEDLPAHALHWLGRDIPLTVLCAHDKAGRLLEAKCDAAMPAVAVPGGVDFVDLDVDLVVDAAGTTTIKDVDAYQRNAALLGYDAETDAAVAAGIELARDLLGRRAAPFDGSGERLLARLASARAGDCSGRPGAA
jgi:protein associated with RNAse G/E